MNKKICIILVCLIALSTLCAASLFRNTTQYYRWFFDRNFRLYTELGDFMISLNHPRAKIYSTDKPYDTIKLFGGNPLVQNFEYDDKYIQALFTDCFENTKAEFVLKKDGYVFFQLRSNRDHAKGFMYCLDENPPQELIIGEDHYSLENLHAKGWYLYTT